jgi:hypothetical protein
MLYYPLIGFFRKIVCLLYSDPYRRLDLIFPKFKVSKWILRIYTDGVETSKELIIQ